MQMSTLRMLARRCAGLASLPGFWLAVILVAFLLLGTLYSRALPLFEAPDESSHLTVVHYFKQQQHLPPPPLVRQAASAEAMAWSLSYHDPPLYYAPPLYYILAAVLIGQNTLADLPDLLIPSPNWIMGWAPQADAAPENKAMFAHLAARENWRGSSTFRAAMLLRGFSLLLGTVTIICTYYLGSLLWPAQPDVSLTAAALVAFTPQFITNAGAVSNNALFNALFSLVLSGLALHLQQPRGWRFWSGMGVLLGLALLTKQSALLLLPLVGLTLLLRERRIAVLWRNALACALPMLLVAGWWYARNAILLGDPLALQMHYDAQISLARLGWAEIWQVLRSFWAIFGWGLLMLPEPVYIGVWSLAGVGALGVLWMLRPGGGLGRLPRVQRHILGLLGAALVLNVGSLARWAVQTGAPYGRLLNPVISVFALLVAWGWSGWFPGKVRVWIGAGLSVTAFVGAALIPALTLRPAYALPYLPEGVPPSAQPLAQAFPGGVTLSGYVATADQLHAGDTVAFTLYWSPPVTATTLTRYRVWVQLGPEDPRERVAETIDWWGSALYPNDLWEAPGVIPQTFRLRIPDWAAAPGLYWLRVGLIDESGELQSLPDGAPYVALGPWRLLPAVAPSAPLEPVQYTLGEQIRLTGYTVARNGVTVTVTLDWLALSAPSADYTVFVHLVTAQGELVALADAPPRNGNYPTSWWLPGQRISDPHTFPCSPATTLEVRVGLYDPHTLLRLPAYDSAGVRLPDDIIPLTLVPCE